MAFNTNCRSSDTIHVSKRNPPVELMGTAKMEEQNSKPKFKTIW